MLNYTKFKKFGESEKKKAEKIALVKKIQKELKAGKKFIELSAEDLKKVGFNPFNRKTNESHLRQIKRDMLVSLSDFPAIVINVITGNLIDGQHRVRAFLQLVKSGQLPEDAKLDVKLVEIENEEEFKTIININTNSKNWSIDDYIRTYVEQGIESYVLLDDFCKEGSPYLYDNKTKKRKYTYAAAILKPSVASSGNNLKYGLFEISHEDIDRGRKKLRELEDLNSVMKQSNKGQWFREFSKVWCVYSELFHHTMTEWKSELRKKSYWIEKPTSKTQFVTMINAAHSAIELKKSQVA